MISYAQAVAVFGGNPRALATAMGVDYAAVSHWQAKKHIPRERVLQLVYQVAPERFARERAKLEAEQAARIIEAKLYLRDRAKDPKGWARYLRDNPDAEADMGGA